MSYNDVAVIIPTYARGDAVLTVIERVLDCDPGPAEIWVHIDSSDGMLERLIEERFPQVQTLSSKNRLGPGGGRHRCLCSCTSPYAVSFDDDSFPVDGDFFAEVQTSFRANPQAAIIGATIWHRLQPPIQRSASLKRVPSFTGCGYAIRVDAYKQTRGFLARPVAYGMEECDLALQMYVANWQILESEQLRVFHDTVLSHHENPEITSGRIANTALFAFLHYPRCRWRLAALQVLNFIVFSVRVGRVRGILHGLMMIPAECFKYRRLRKPIDRETLDRFVRFRRSAASRLT